MSKERFDRHEEHVLLPFRKKVFYGFGGLGDTLLGNGMTQVAAVFNIVFKVDAFWIGMVLLAPRVWDAVTDPLMGHISDNTRTRWGRRRPYVLWGGILTAILFLFLLCPPATLRPRGMLGYLLFVSMLYFTAYTVFSVSYNALGLEMSLDYHERTRVMGFRSFLNSGGGILASWGLWLAYRPELGSPVVGARVMGLLFALIAGAAFVTVALGTREAEGRARAEEDRLRRIAEVHRYEHSVPALGNRYVPVHAWPAGVDTAAAIRQFLLRLRRRRGRAAPNWPD